MKSLKHRITLGTRDAAFASLHALCLCKCFLSVSKTRPYRLNVHLPLHQPTTSTCWLNSSQMRHFSRVLSWMFLNKFVLSLLYILCTFLLVWQKCVEWIKERKKLFPRQLLCGNQGESGRESGDKTRLPNPVLPNRDGGGGWVGGLRRLNALRFLSRGRGDPAPTHSSPARHAHNHVQRRTPRKMELLVF